MFLVAFVSLLMGTADAVETTEMCHGKDQLTYIEDLRAAKDDIDKGKLQRAIALMERAERRSAARSRAGYDKNVFDYVHAAAMILDGQPQVASGNVIGIRLMRQAVNEATGIAKRKNLDPDLKKLSRDLAYNGTLELRSLRSAKMGQLFTPPPTAPP